MEYIYVILLSILFVTLVSATTVTIQTAGSGNLRDAYVMQKNPDKNYGGASEVEVMNNNGDGKNIRTYITFNIFNISSVPAGNTINDASLCLYKTVKGTATQNASAYHVLDSTWKGTSETTITWNNQPCGASFTNSTKCNLTAQSTVDTGAYAKDTWVCWNVTKSFQYEYALSHSNLSIALKTPENAKDDKGVTFYSKEFGTAGPLLNVTYSDSTGPAIAFVSPSDSNGANVSRGWTYVNVTSVDALSNISACRLEWNGTANSTMAVVGSGSRVSCYLNKSAVDGAYSYKVYSNDSAGNWNATATRTITFDKTAPTVAIQYPRNGLNLSNNISILLNFIATDSGTGINTSTCAYSLDGISFPITNCANTTFNISTKVEGNHNISVSAKDNVGNQGTSSLINFTIDKNGPSISIQSPDQSYNYSTANINLNFIAVDSVSGLNTSSCFYTLDGAPTTLVNCNNKSLAVPGNGTHRINVTASDNAGNSNTSTTTTFVVDTVKPSISLNSPEPGANLTASTVNFNWAATDNLAATMLCNLTINGAVNASNQASTSSIPKNYTVTFTSDGTYNWDVTCADNAGNVGTSATQSLTINTYANVSLIKINQTALQASPGGIVQFKITVNNTGNVTLNGTVTDVLPSNLTFASAYPTNSTSWSFVNLAPGLTSIFYINATVNPGVVSVGTPTLTLTNYASVTAEPPNGNNVTANSSANVTVYYANVSVIKLDQTAQQPSPGGIVGFNITIKNEGNVTLDPVEVVDALPDGLTFVDATPYPDNVSGQQLTWDDVGPIGPGDSYVIYTSAKVDDGIVDEGTPTKSLSNHVKVTGTPPNGNDVTAEDDADVTVSYATVAVLKADITPVPASPGGAVQWLITITNPGKVPLGLLVTDVLPEGLGYVDADPPADEVSGDGTETWSTLPTLGIGATQYIYLNSTANANGTYSNTVTVVGVPPNGNNVTASHTASVGINASAITVVKTVNPASVTIGRNATFNLTITNTGEVNLTVNAVDTLPENVSFNGATVDPDDATGGVITWDDLAYLAPWENITLLYNASANASGTYSNKVVVEGVPGNGGSVRGGDSASFTVSAPPAPASPEDKDNNEPLSVSASSTCGGNVVSVESSSGPLSGAKVTVNGKSIGTTNSNGKITFEGCDISDAIIRASKSGYDADSTTLGTVTCSECGKCTASSDCPADKECSNGNCVAISCGCGKIENHACTQYECCADSACQNGYSCVNNACVFPFECTKDSDCKDSEYCVIQTGQAGGDCKGVGTGCGVVSNHALVPYEFPYGCATSGCPACPSSYLCENNKCSQYVVTAPEAKAGGNATLHVTVDGKPCSECSIIITAPDGSTRSADTDENGNLILPFDSPGDYKISLPGGSVLPKALTIGTAPKAREVQAEQQAEQVVSTPLPMWGVPPVILLAGALLLLGIAAGLFFLWRRGKKPGNEQHRQWQKK